MTQIEALENSIIVWNWLSENPNMDKEDCTIINTTELYNNCSLCHITEDDHCADCVMYDRWPSATGYVEACVDDSAYENFDDAILNMIGHFLH